MGIFHTTSYVKALHYAITTAINALASAVDREEKPTASLLLEAHLHVGATVGAGPVDILLGRPGTSTYRVSLRTVSNRPARVNQACYVTVCWCLLSYVVPVRDIVVT